jgi:hypothetical protein
MSHVSARYATIAAGFTARVEGCPEDKWDAPSPCESWTARDVVSQQTKLLCFVGRKV